MSYYIVVGRMHGDDEASAFVVAADDSAEAIGAFQREIIAASGDTYDGGELPDDGEGAVYIDHVFHCGRNKPTHI